MKRICRRNFSNYFVDFHKLKSIDPNFKIENSKDGSVVEKMWGNQYNINVSNFSYKYINQTLACVLNPELRNHKEILPESAKKATEFLEKHKVKIGAYSNSRGHDVFVHYVNDYINNRDQTRDSKPEDILFTNGSNSGYFSILKTFFNKGDSILMPSPCHPLTAEKNTLNGINNVYYDLNQGTWEINIEEIQKALDLSGKKDTRPRALYVHSPHFPTGKMLSEKEMQEIVKFCVENQLFLIANESLQTNCHFKKFSSFRKVIKGMEAPYNQLEMISLFSLGNGKFIQQAMKGGFVESLNISPDVMAQFLKLKSIELCANVPAQLLLALNVADIRKEGFSDDFCEAFEKSVDENVLFNLKALELFHFKIKMLGFKCDFPDAGIMFFADSTGVSEYKDKIFQNNLKGEHFGTNPDLKKYSVLHMSKI